jgi:hypothetical protein
MRKKFFAGMAVLLSVSLFFLGCPSDPDDNTTDERSDNAVIATLKIKGVDVDITGTDDGSAFDKPVTGKVTFAVNAAGSSVFAPPSGATVQADFVDAPLADEAAFGGGERTLYTNAQEFDAGATFAEGEHFLYLKVTAENETVKWYKIAITVVQNFPVGSATSFTIVELFGGNVAELKIGNAAATKYAVSEALYSVLDAIYEPNKPEATADVLTLDEVSGGAKQAAPYDAALSAAVLGLFHVGVKADGTVEKIEIKGTTLPAVVTDKLTVIDLGKPGVANSGLPIFEIPDQELGEAEDDDGYAHIRLRVNKGAELVIQADNSSYIESGSGNPCETGYFNGGCVEVMEGGKLRDAAYEGFPLGTEAVILNRNGSYLSVGPMPGSTDATGNAENAYNAYYAGYLLAPTGNQARIEWDAANTAGNYLEVRDGQIATDAHLTVKTAIGLIYSVWFVNDAAVTIDNGGDLFANEQAGDFNFYATAKSTPQTVITVSAGGKLDKRFLTNNSNQTQNVGKIEVAESGIAVVIKAPAANSPVAYGEGTGITGTLIPVPSEG